MDEVAGVVPRLAELREEFGRDGDFEIKALCTDAFEASGFQRMADIGVTEAMVCPWFYRPGDVESLDHQVESVLAFGEEHVGRYTAG
jgi:hypothetical protein